MKIKRMMIKCNLNFNWLVTQNDFDIISDKFMFLAVFFGFNRDIFNRMNDKNSKVHGT